VKSGQHPDWSARGGEHIDTNLLITKDSGLKVMNASVCMAFVAVTLLAGCTSGSGPAAVAQDVPVQAEPVTEGITTTLTRVVPERTQIHWDSYQVTTVCAPDGSRPCKEPIIDIGSAVVGTTYENPEWAVTNRDALFWRLEAVTEFATDNPVVTEATVTVYTRKPCGFGCWEEREVDHVTGPSPLVFERRDVYLEPGETGLLLRLSAANPSATVGLDVEYSTRGNADGYVPAGDPPIVIQS
jgi:hypothetical protein